MEKASASGMGFYRVYLADIWAQVGMIEGKPPFYPFEPGYDEARKVAAKAKTSEEALLGFLKIKLRAGT